MKKQDLSRPDGPKLTDGLGSIDRDLLGIGRWLIFAAAAEQHLTIADLAIRAGLNPVTTEDILLDESVPLSSKLITRLSKALRPEASAFEYEGISHLSRTLSRGRQALKNAQAVRAARQAAK